MSTPPPPKNSWFKANLRFLLWLVTSQGISVLKETRNFEYTRGVYGSRSNHLRKPEDIHRDIHIGNLDVYNTQDVP